MLHISTQKLIEKLLERTQKGTIDWKEREPDGVILETEGYTVELTKGPASVRLSQGDGRLLEDVSEENLKSATDSAGRDYADIVTELTIEADRFAKGTEQAIASILDAVEASSTPVLKSGPAFPGRPKNAIETPTISESEEADTDIAELPQVETSDLSDTDPYTEAGMSAAVGKMVAEINGEPAGDELDALQSEEDNTPQEVEATTEIEQVSEVEEEQIVSTEETPVEAVVEEEAVSEFKTHIVETPPTVLETETVEALETTEFSVPEEIETPDEADTELVTDISLDDIPVLEDASADIMTDAPEVLEVSEVLASPPPALDLPETLTEDVLADSDIIPPPVIEVQEAELPSEMELPDVAEALDIPDIEPQELAETIETAPEAPAITIPEDVAEPELPPVVEPVEEIEEAPKSIGFSFHNKVTATGMTLAGNIGTLVPGVPDDIRQRADEHERKVKLQNEKIEAEKRAEEARKAADEAEKKRNAVGFKSWS